MLAFVAKLKFAIADKSILSVTRAKILEWSIRAARNLNDLYVNPEHMFLGMLDSNEQYFHKYLSPLQVNNIRNEIHLLRPKDAPGRKAYDHLEQFHGHPKVTSLLQKIEQANKEAEESCAQSDYNRAGQFVRDAEHLRIELVDLLLNLEEEKGTS